MARILIVSGVFPPYASIGSTRVGKSARYLSEAGHDVRVLTANSHALPRTAPLEIPLGHVVATRAMNLHWPSEIVQGGRAAVVRSGGRRHGPLWIVLHRLWAVYRNVTYIPDYLVLWYPFARAAGSRLFRTWRPDVILASGPPPTAYLVGRSLAREVGVPWVADMRDLWVDNPTYAFTAWRRQIDTWIERRVLGSAAALVTVSNAFAKTLRSKFPQRVVVAENGFDPSDMPPSAGQPATSPGLRVVFTGTLYPGRHNLGPLFEALRVVVEAGHEVKLLLVGRLCGEALPVAKAAGVAAYVEAMTPVQYEEALRMQAAADVLLLLTFAGEGGKSYHHAKIYEYIAARRPILVVGAADGEAGTLVEQWSLGRVGTEVSDLTKALLAWAVQKESEGGIPPTNENVAKHFTRQEQIAKIGALLVELVAQGGNAHPMDRANEQSNTMDHP